MRAGAFVLTIKSSMDRLPDDDAMDEEEDDPNDDFESPEGRASSRRGCVESYARASLCANPR